MPSRRRLLTTLGTTGTVILAGCNEAAESDHPSETDESVYSPGTDADTGWPMPAYDRGFSACNPDAAAPRDDVTERWSVRIDASLPRRPVVAAGKVLVATASGLVATDVESGDEQWRYDRTGDGPVTMTAPVVHDGMAYFGFNEPRGLIAVDVESGDRQWHAPTTGFVDAAPTFALSNERLYAGDDTGRIYQIDPANGEITARTEVFGSVTEIVYSDTTVLVGTSGGEVYSFYRNGAEITGNWRRRVDGAVTALTAADNEIYVSTWSGSVYRLADDNSAGSSRWETDRSAVGGLAVASDDVVGFDTNSIRTFDPSTGDVGWDREASFTAAPAVAGDTIYVGGATAGDDGTGFVAAYPLRGGGNRGPLRPGNERWRFDVDGVPGVGIAVADGAVFACAGGLSSEDGPQVYALEPV
ncbi:PQQ repeat-containing protein [Halovivax asiaticus JCM 14624]|uniref:PQQ repeat-containing protein n=1 Tax=Halovivax asiaticus JCM 14624 TaxID=1227490 RepID=M0BF07_9EURY|nr:PQQ-binding-like beta-propeller repeat protein [Halovivax asiaticus]ELZ08888.1 PQQ repeat-containing protein [Halovivax asiaticus JCM 14624]